MLTQSNHGSRNNFLGELLHVNSSLRFIARGMSMFPFIRPGDIVTVHVIGKKPVRPGDIVAYIDRSTKRITSHRILDLNGPFVLTRGDNNTCRDEQLGRQDILGKVVHVHRRGKELQFSIKWGKRMLAVLSGANILHKILRRLFVQAHMCAHKLDVNVF